MSRRRSQLHLLDGRHPFKSAVPGGYVDYPVRRRGGGRVLLFNFELAREMGLLPRNHPDVLDRRLQGEVLDCFGLEIVNEYEQRRDPSAVERAGPRRYMATRHLQLQHPGRQGRTSGDGRSIWNGMVRGTNGAWDVSSCGTGATCLSPATAIHGRFFRTGDPSVSYGCGRAELWDAICAALMSEILHHNGVRTERTLAIIDYGDGSCIGVRAYPNLMRPAHLFHWLKQNDHAGLKAAADYYIGRETADGRWPRLPTERERYRYLLERITEDFARAAAQFESEYIFCWLDWDGDNILLDGAIIDYGSVRQFGLFHHEYRYDDVDRLSTTITEQRLKARYIVQATAQLADFLATGRKKNIKAFRRAPRWRASMCCSGSGRSGCSSGVSGSIPRSTTSFCGTAPSCSTCAPSPGSTRPSSGPSPRAGPTRCPTASPGMPSSACATSCASCPGAIWTANRGSRRTHS